MSNKTKSNIRVEFPRFFYGNSHYTANKLFDAHLLSPATLQDGKKVASKLDEVDENTSICTESGHEKASGGTDMAHDTLSFAFSPTLNRTDLVNAEVMSSSAVPVVHVYPPSDEDLTMNSLRRYCKSVDLFNGKQALTPTFSLVATGMGREIPNLLILVPARRSIFLTRLAAATTTEKLNDDIKTKVSNEDVTRLAALNFPFYNQTILSAALNLPMVITVVIIPLTL
uniref:Uncharacterized protein n=1 Tax=Glossina palpalis gambiensis TaxID=67801 RepID=A0A1B0BH72_9MUSC